MKVGIVGLPNAGKSTLFNALTKGGAQTGDYPFTTIEPNVAIAQVPDERLEQVAETVRSSELVPATIAFHDIAGLVKGASEGEGLGNQFLASIRETDAICHVVRCHADSGVPHPDGRVDPLADIETIETELVLSDYEQAERRLHRVGKGAKSGDAEAIAERDWLETGASRRSPRASPARSVPVPDAAAARPAQPAGADLEADPLRRQRRRGRRRGARGGRRPRRRGRRRRGRGQRPDRGRAGRARPGRSGGDARVLRGRGLRPRPPRPRRLRPARADHLLHRRRGQGGGRPAAATAAPPPGRRRGRSTPRSRTPSLKAEAIGWRELVECGGYAPARDKGLCGSRAATTSSPTAT